MARFRYHASAIGAAGSLYAPWKEYITAQASAALPETGGIATASASYSEDRRVLQFRHAHCRLIGRLDERTGTHETEATVVIEDLNILDMITADRITGRLVTSHNANTAETPVITTGSHFENLRIAGQLIEIDLANDVFAKYPTFDSLTKICTERAEDCGYQKAEDLEDHVAAQTFMAAQYSPSGWDSASPRVGECLPQDRQYLQGRDVITASLIKDVAGVKYPVKRVGHVVEIEGFGIVRLAELSIRRNWKRLIMLQANLGSPVHADLLCGSTEGNGSDW